jgi:ribose transport system substrate-binding protein
LFQIEPHTGSQMRRKHMNRSWTKAAPVALAVAVAFGTGLRPAGAEDTAKIIAEAAKTPDSSFCGTKKMTLGVHDGFGVNGWSRASMAAVRSEAAKCANVKQVIRIGQGDLQRSISDVNGLVSEGVDALAIIPDWGKSQLPSLRAATDAGVKVVPWAADPAGNDRDYVAYLDWDEQYAGAAWAEWVAKALHGEGNVVFLGGPAGNPVSAHELAGVVETFKKYPKIKLLTGDKEWPVTNWDSAMIQQQMTALLGKYPKIDAVINDSDGFAALGVVRAYQAADKPLVPLASLEANGLACEYLKLKDKNPNFQIGTISSRNWIGRIAARKAIAAAQGIPNSEPTRFNLGIFEDSLGGRAPICDPAAGPDTFNSNHLSGEELAKYGKPE